MELLDETRPIRPGEELDLEKLTPYLRRALDAPEGDVQVQQFPEGHSNLTYLVKVGDREAVLRRPPFGSKVRTAHDMGREFRVLSRIAPVHPHVPRVIAYCEDLSILGAKFYLMERVPGLILRRGSAGTFDPETRRRVCGAFVDALAELHAVDYVAAGLGDFGNPVGYADRQVTGWTKRYADAQTDPIPEVAAVAAWLAGNVPPSSGASLIHNDFKLDNLVLDPRAPERILAILDWEMSTIGDPLMDLGTALAYWVEEGDPEELKAIRFGPTTLPGNLTRRQIVERYADRSGRAVSGAVFQYCFGLFKTAVVAQQIYYRYQKGLTHDPRFASWLEGVRILARQAERHLALAEV